MIKPFDVAVWEAEVETRCCKQRYWIPCPAPTSLPRRKE